MPKFTAEYKITKNDENGTETRLFKRTLDEGQTVALQAILVDVSCLEYLTIRRVPEKKPVPPAKQLLKETK